jgi:hypothetical protein
VTSIIGTLFAMVGLLTAGGTFPSPWLLVTLVPGAFGLLLLPFRSMRAVAVGFLASLLVPALFAVLFGVNAVVQRLA